MNKDLNEVWKNCCEAWSCKEEGHLAIVSAGYNKTTYQTVVIYNDKIVKKLTQPTDFFTDCISYTVENLITHFKSRADSCEETLRQQKRAVLDSEVALNDANGIINILNSLKE